MPVWLQGHRLLPVLMVECFFFCFLNALCMLNLHMPRREGRTHDGPGFICWRCLPACACCMLLFVCGLIAPQARLANAQPLLSVELFCASVQMGFTNTMDSCRETPSFLGSLTDGYADGICSNPEAYIFWEPVHPTKHTHEAIATAFMTDFPALNQS